MDDKRLEVLAQYSLTVKSCYHARGALLLETDCGLKLLRPCQSGEQRLEFEDAVKQHINQQGGLYVDTVCRTTEGSLFAENTYGDRFCIRDWYPGDECNLKLEEHCRTAVTTLNLFHNLTKGFKVEDSQKIYQRLPLTEQFMKRTRELKRVRGYIRDKKQKSEFELYYLRLCDVYYEQALVALEYIQGISETEREREKLIHGNFNYHSLLLDENRDDLFILTSFDKTGLGSQVSDFYYLLRKTMEKNDWNIALGHDMMEQYFKERENQEEERKLLLAQILFPEKFWKITNYYYNNRKSWIPQKNIGKMFSNHDREPLKAEFIRTIL